MTTCLLGTKGHKKDNHIPFWDFPLGFHGSYKVGGPPFMPQITSLTGSQSPESSDSFLEACESAASYPNLSWRRPAPWCSLPWAAPFAMHCLQSLLSLWTGFFISCLSEASSPTTIWLSFLVQSKERLLLLWSNSPSENWGSF